MCQCHEFAIEMKISIPCYPYNIDVLAHTATKDKYNFMDNINLFFFYSQNDFHFNVYLFICIMCSTIYIHMPYMVCQR